MRRYCLCFFISLVFVLSTFMGNAQSSLLMYRTFGGTHFEYTKDTMVYSVSPKQVLQILDDPLAIQEFKKARAKSSMAGILGFTGMVLIAIPTGAAIAGGDPEWAFAAGGAAAIVASLPLTRAFRRQAQNAIDIYNKKHTAFKPRAEYYLSGLGARIIIRF